MKQEALELTQAEPVAEVEHRGVSWRLSRADTGAWEIQRLAGGAWRHADWVADLKEMVVVAEMAKLVGGRLRVPVEVLRRFAEKAVAQ